MYKCLCGPVFPALRGVCLGAALLGRGSVLFHIFRAHPADFQSDGAILHALHPPRNLRGCQFPHLVAMFVLLVLFEPFPQDFVLAFKTYSSLWKYKQI